MFIKYSNSGGSSEDRYSVYRAPRLGQARGFSPDGNLLKQFLRYCLHIEAVKRNKYSLVPLESPQDPSALAHFATQNPEYPRNPSSHDDARTICEITVYTNATELMDEYGC